jgi:predicted helicase
MDDFWRKETKLEWFGENPLSSISFERITPNDKHNWINLADNDFETLLPLASKEVKLGKQEAVLSCFLWVLQLIGMNGSMTSTKRILKAK